MRILWLSNKILSEKDSGATGTWLDALSHELMKCDELELGNITLGNIKKMTRQDCGSICQWLVPSGPRLDRHGLPPRNIIHALIKSIDEFSPDMIHIWGTERYWGLLSARKHIGVPALLEMQGLKGAIAQVFNGGLSFREQLSCIGPKELMRQSSIFQSRQKFESWAPFEEEMISGHRFISIHSDWMMAKVKAVNNNARLFRSVRALRDPFYEGKKWAFHGTPSVFCSAAYPSPFKGLHVAIRSLATLKKNIPDIQLRIAGAHQQPGFRREGYIAWINREIVRLGIESNVTWLGPLSAIQLVEELGRCSAFIMPTFVESYSVTLAEAMLLGVPTVVSFTGGTSFLARDEESALFFSPGDEEMCAYQVERLIKDQGLAERLSCQARDIAQVRHDRNQILQRQIITYRQVLEDPGNQLRVVEGNSS